jgi:hypothetical protein
VAQELLEAKGEVMKWGFRRNDYLAVMLISAALFILAAWHFTCMG